MPAVCGVSRVVVMGGAETQQRRAAERRGRAGLSHGGEGPLTSRREAGPCWHVTRGCGAALTSHGAARPSLLCQRRRAVNRVLPARVNPGRAQAEPGGWRGPLALCGVAEQLPLALSTHCSPASPSPRGFRPSGPS